eukprot:6340467-Prymnesium_polylepis.1
MIFWTDYATEPDIPDVETASATAAAHAASPPGRPPGQIAALITVNTALVGGRSRWLAVGGLPRI